MSTAQDLDAIEITIEEARKKIARKEGLVRLQQNADFSKLIEKGFLEDHAVRQVLLKAHPGMQGESVQKMLDQQITAIGGFKQYLISIFSEGMEAEASLEADEETREELLEEDLNHG
jgi:hypothetical protein